MARFSFCGGTYQAVSPNMDAEFCMNRYPESDESGNARSRMALIPVPGLKQFGTLPAGSGESVPGGFSYNGRTFCVGITIAAQQMHLYEVMQDGSMVDRSPAGLGAPVTTAPAIWAANPNQVAFVAAGTGKVYVLALATNAITIVNTYQDTAGAFAAASLLYMDGFFVTFLQNSNTFQVSNLEDATTWLGINIASVSEFPDNIIAMKATQRTLVFLGRKSSVPYYNGGGLFPFIPVPGTLIEEGSAATYGIEEIDNTILWVGANDDEGQGMAWRLNGYTPQRISTHAVETAWQRYTRIDDVISYKYQIRGHKFWGLYFPTANATWVFDIAESQWHQEGTWNPLTSSYTARPIQWHTFNFGRHLVGDPFSGKIYEMSEGFATDNGAPIRRVRRAPYIAREHANVFHDLFELLCESGIGAGIQAGSQRLGSICLADSTGQPWLVTVNDNGAITANYAPPGTVASTPIIADSVDQSTFWQIAISTGGALFGVPVAFGRADVILVKLATQPVGDNLIPLDGGLQVDQEGTVSGIAGQIHYRAPSVELRWSDDGAHSWSNYHSESMGLTGEYAKRVRWQRLGKSRNRVYETVDSDPVNVVFIDAYINGPGNASVERLNDQLRKQA